MPRTGRPKGPGAKERLRDRLKRDTVTGCLVFQGTGKINNQYGRLKVDGKMVYAHRLAWEQTHGPIPDGFDVLHHCDNPPCCEAELPGHLFLGTHADNMQDRDQKGRHVAHRGEDHTKAKLTADDVREIRAARRAGEKPASIGRRYQDKVSPSKIYQILRGEAWTHIV